MSLGIRIYALFLILLATEWAGANPNSALQNFRDQYAQISADHNLTPEIDGQRFISPSVWQYVVENGENQPWRVFGDQTFNNWMATAQWITNREAQAALPAIQLYDSIESRVMQGHYFRGYEIRRIQHAAATDSIPQAYAQRLIQKIEEGENVYFSGQNHAELIGKYRWHPLDEFEHNGESFDEQGRRYLTAEEIQSAQNNPLLTVDIPSIQSLGPNKYRGRILYPRVKDLKALVAASFAEFDQAHHSAQDLEGQVRAIVKLQRDLITIHRSLDGNGRSIRLLADALLLRLGLPPPLKPIENEMFLPLDEIFEKTLEQMEAYLEVVELSRYQPPRPRWLFHWTTKNSFSWMATKGAKGLVPMQTISETSRFALNHPVLANAPGTHVWPNPHFSLRGGAEMNEDLPNKGIEWYAKPDKKNVLIAYLIQPHARIKTIRTFVEEDKFAKTTAADFQGVDLVYHQHLNPDQTLAFHEWIILNAEAVSQWTHDPQEIQKILQENQMLNPPKEDQISIEHRHFINRPESDELEAIEKKIWQKLFKRHSHLCEFLLGA